jgi:predicted dehydrogenase
MKKIKWGIISTGTIAHSFAEDFKYVKHGELVAVASRNQQSAQEFADKYAIPKAYATYEQLYNDAEIDAIYIATPHTFHLQNSMDALDKGKSVLCEKPITTNQKDFNTLSSFAKKQEGYLMEGMWTYFLPAILKAQEWIAQGRIGEVKQVKADFGYPVLYDPKGRMYNPELAGGSLLDMGVYPLAMAWLFFKKDPNKMTVLRRNAPTGVDNEMTMIFEYADEVANLSSSFRCKLHNHLFIIGTEGYIQIPEFWRAKECLLYKVEEQIDHFVDPRESLGFNFEAEAVSLDILAGKKESEIMPLHYSNKLQQFLADALAASL